MHIDKLKKGQTVILRPSFGREPPIKVVLDDVERGEEEAVIYTDSEGNGRWAYPDQVERIVSHE